MAGIGGGTTRKGAERWQRGLGNGIVKLGPRSSFLDSVNS